MKRGRLISAVLLAGVLLPMRPHPQAVTPAPAPLLCGDLAGARFNLETVPTPPNRFSRFHPKYQPSVDILPNRVRSGVDLVVGGASDLRAESAPVETPDVDFVSRSSGYYVSRTFACAPDFEGALPPVNLGNTPLFGAGTVVVAADAARDAVFVADFRAGAFGSDTTIGVAIFRASASRLLDPVACPPGTHTPAQATTCWSTAALVFDRPGRLLGLTVLDMVVDERPQGAGSGTVYVTSLFSAGVGLVACTNDLSACSAPVPLQDPSGDIGFLPSLAVRPDGGVSIVSIRFSGDENADSIVHVACEPAQPPAAPVCGGVNTIAANFKILRDFDVLPSQAFSPLTYPRHAHRTDASGIETYAVWHQCKVESVFLTEIGSRLCPDVDVVLAASRDNGQTWSAETCVDCLSRDQLFPAIKADPARNVVSIAYYGATNDFYGHGLQVFLRQIRPGGATPDAVTAPQLLTTHLNNPSATGVIVLNGPSQERPTFLSGARLGAPSRLTDTGGDPPSFFGQTLFPQFLGLTTRGIGGSAGRTYVHFTFNTVRAKIAGINVPGPNNHMTRVDF
jgi:hypothetical protein